MASHMMWYQLKLDQHFWWHYVCIKWTFKPRTSNIIDEFESGLIIEYFLSAQLQHINQWLFQFYWQHVYYSDN